MGSQDKTRAGWEGLLLPDDPGRALILIISLSLGLALLRRPNDRIPAGWLHPLPAQCSVDQGPLRAG